MEKKAVLLEALEQAKEPTLPELLFRYLELRSGERAGGASRGKLKGTVADYNKVQAAMDFLRKREISTVESLDTRLDEISQTAVSIMGSMKKSEKRIKSINTMLSYIDKYEAVKPVHAEYAAIGWKKKKEKFAESHREELEAVQADVKVLRDVRNWLNQALPPEQRKATSEPGKKPSIAQTLSWKSEAARQREAQKQQQTPKKQQNMEL